jgi:hypothetical protein
MKRSIVLALAFAGCFSDPDPTMVGEAEATITNVPAQVACIQITVAGARNVTRRFDVSPGQSSVLGLKGLPVGPVAFTGSAYAASCATVGGSAPSWLSDATPATLVGGAVVNVSLVLRRNGEANVSVDFQDDGPDGGFPGPDGGVSPTDLSTTPFDAGFPVDLARPDFGQPLDLAQPVDLANGIG